MTPARTGDTALLLANSSAGSATEDGVAAVEAVLRERLDVTRRAPEHPDDLRAIVRDHRVDRIIVAGGDGSLHLLLNVLDDLGRLSDTVIGVIPMGTGNDFTTGIGLPDDPSAAARISVGDTTLPVDALVADDGEVVVNAAHTGVGAVASEQAQPAKPYVGALAYPLAALVTGVTKSGFDQTVTVDGDVVHDGPAMLTLVANGPSVGGGARLCPDADPRDGLLDVLVITAVALRDRPALARDLRRGAHLERDDVALHRGTAVRIRSASGDHSRDGELRSALYDTTYRVAADAWTMLWDPGATRP